MVARKPLPPNASIDPKIRSNMQDAGQEPFSGAEPEASADNIWGNEPHAGVPAAGNAGKENGAVQLPIQPITAASQLSNLPQDNVWSDVNPSSNSQSLAGVGSGATPVTSVQPSSSQGDLGGARVADAGIDVDKAAATLSPTRPETNPFKRQMTGGSSAASGANSQDPSRVPTPANIPILPSGSLSQLSLSEPSNNPWQPALDKKEGLARSLPHQPSSQPDVNSPALLSLPSEESAGWEEEARKDILHAGSPPVEDDLLGDSHAWDDLGTVDKGKGLAKSTPMGTSSSNSGAADDWNLIDVEPPPGPPPGLKKQDTWENFADGEEDAPPLPVRKDSVKAPSLPPRKDAAAAPLQHQRAVSKSETYQIKNISWHDVTAANNPRASPILVQNANGPCPLVALVNALTLTTPAETTTALVDVLRSREQVSLSLLLDAVFDELMSPRRTKEGDALPDVTELYAFLQGLHTGMNVNPRFIPTPEVITAFKRTSLTHLHPSERGDHIPGTFEDTKEMALYSTFSVPLIHGWLPQMGEPAYDAFARHAVSYEDAQNLMFREEELEDKLSNPSHEGLTHEEQQIYQDVLTIKSFLSISATQLTHWGLEVITKAMKPGSVAILFRNDHFSTLYRHPQTLQLLAVVTDAGYAGHAEVVWESLVDVSGENSEFLSGDFRVVGGASHGLDGGNHMPGGYPSSSRTGGDWYADADDSNGWTTVQGRKNRAQNPAAAGGDVPLSPKHEQEDRDLALALQLQEEEEERVREEEARRVHERQLSQQFIEQNGPSLNQPSRGCGGSPASVRGRGGLRGSPQMQQPSARRSSNAVNVPVTTTPSRAGRGGSSPNLSTAPTSRVRASMQNVRSLLPPRNTNDGVNRPTALEDDDAPPSYDEAAKESPYVPPQGHPSHPRSDRRASAATTASGSGSVPVMQIGRHDGGGPSRGRMSSMSGYSPGRMRQGVPPAAMAGNGGGSKDRDCVVM